MKKLYTFLASAVFAATAVTAQVSLPYVSGSMTVAPGASADDNAWTQLDSSGAEPWYFQVNAQRCFEVDTDKGHDAYLLRLNRGEQDDWLVSPAFNIKGDTEYKITFYAAKSSAAAVPDEFKVYFTGFTPLRDKDFVLWYDNQSVTDLPDPVDYAPVYKKYEMTFSTDPGETGSYYFAFYVKSASKTGLIGIADVTIEELGGEEGSEEPEQPEQPGITGKPVPYESTIAVSSGVFDEGWTTINANNDAKVWVACTEYSNDHSMTGLYADCPYNGSMDSDDFLSSPAIYLEAGKEYKVLYGYRTYNLTNKEHMTVYATQSVESADAIKAGVMLADYNDDEGWSDSQNVWKRYASTFVPETSGAYYISFHACSVKNKYHVYVSDFAVLENVFAPAGVSGFTATAAEGRVLECNLAWTLPTKSVFDDPFTDDQTVEKVSIYRDGAEAPIATLTGAVTEFTDTEATGLTSGYHTYSVKVTVAGVESPAVEAKSRYVGPVTAVDVPVELKLNTADDFDLYTVIYGPAYSPTGTTDVWSVTTAKQIQLYSGSATVEDSWLIAPPVKVSAPGYYRVTLSARVSYDSSNYSHQFEYCVGTDCTIEAMEVRSTDIGLTTSLSDHYFDFYAAEAGVYYIGIHGCDDKPSKGTYANTFSLASIKVDSSKRLPAAVSGLTAVPAADESLNIDVCWTNPTVSFAGDAMGRDEYKVLVYLDGELALTLDGEQLVEGTQTVTLPVQSTGVYTVKVQTVALDGEASTIDVHPTVTTSWVGPRTVDLPYTADFSAGEHPSFAIWSIIDGNNDGKTWTIDMTSYSKAAKLSGNSLVNGLYEYNDYLLTPDFELTPGMYAVSVYAYGGSSTSPFYFNLGAFKSGEFSTDKAAWTAQKLCKVGGYTYTECTFEFLITESGKYQVVIAADEAFSSSVYNHLNVKSFAIKAVVALPEIATDVTVTPGADFALEAIVKWTNPTATSFEGVALAEGDITKAVIYRNGEEVGVVEEDLIPGLEASFTDDTLVAGGVYTYKVEIYTANGCSETPATEVKSTWIGPGILIPENNDGLCYGPDWEDGPFAGWTIVDANNTNKVLEVNWTYGLGITSNNITPDCYAYSRPIQFEKSNIYRVVVDSHYNFDVLGEVTPELHYGTSEDVAEFVKVGEWSIPETCTSRTKLHTATFYLYAVDASELEAQTEEAGDDELISKSVKIPAGAVRLALRANDKGSYYLRNIEIRREKSFTGADAVSVADGIAYSAEGITFDGEAAVEVYSLTGMLVAADARAEGRFDLSTVAKGVYVVRVSPVNGKAVTLKIVK